MTLYVLYGFLFKIHECQRFTNLACHQDLITLINLSNELIPKTILTLLNDC